MKAANPYLNFAGNTEEAFEFYRSVFGGDFLAVLRYRDFEDDEMGVSGSELDKIAHIALPLGQNALLMGTDTIESMPMTLTQGNNFYITIEPDTGDEADALFAALSAGGEVQMPLQKTSWSEKYGTCVDQFGVQWMIVL